MMVPKPPPSAVCRFSSSTASVALGLAAGEDDDAAAVERALHDVLHAVGRVSTLMPWAS